MENLRIDASGQYFLQGREPFFWLGDTAWLLLQKCTKEQAYIYLRNRKEKGYNVIQTVFLHHLNGSDPGSLAAGTKDVTSDAYGKECEEIIGMAEEMGLYIGLLPCWGSLVKEGIIHEENAADFAEKLAVRFERFTNIVWILGGDVRGEGYETIYRTMGEIFKTHNPERLVTFHPFGRTTSAFWFHNEPWLDFNMFQSGHRRYDQKNLSAWDDNAKKEEWFGEDSFRYVERDLARTPRKPVLDGEPSYEGIPKGLHNPRNGYWQAKDVRRYAWWSVLAGAAGFTYGDNAIMQFYDADSKKGSYGVREYWTEAMHHAGSGQMRFLKDLMLSIDFTKGKPCNELLRSGQKERYLRVSVFAAENVLLAYSYSGEEFDLDLTSFAKTKTDLYWYNPENGTKSYAETLNGPTVYHAVPPRRDEESNDWVLLAEHVKE